ncbi:MAG: T9SS type B sorting domain-containing protein, partial [Sphingobacteriaceae bacterium]
FTTTNTPNGTINNSSVDLDPSTTGIQTTYAVVSKGTFKSDGNGNITFTPLNSTVSGTAVCNFTVADNYGATSNSATVTATINTAPVLTGSQTNVTCSGGSNGSATVVTSTGTAPYTYSWSPSGGSAATASNLSAGTYTVTVTDANGCSSARSYIITQPAVLTATAAQTDVGVYGGNTGSATINVSGGTMPYTYLWLPAGGNAATASNLSAGNYTVTATDANGCTVTRSYTITQPAVSTNSNLSNFTISSGTISPTFATGTTSYSTNVTSSVNSVTVVPTTSDGYAAIKVNGVAVSSGSASQVIALIAGSNTITTVVTAQDGTSKTYTLTIIKLKDSQTVAFNSIPTKTYGDADFDAGATASSGLAVTYTSSNQSVATIVNNKVHLAGAGTATITASQAGDDTYYAATNVTQTLTVNKASLTITATNQSKTYATVNPPLTAVYTGFVNGETSADLTTQPAITTTATTTSVVGSYPITVSGAASPNYQITYVNGALSVYPGIQTITFTAAPKTYGDPDFTVSATASSGLPVTYSSSNTAVATVDNDGTVHIVKAGNVVISAIQTGNGNYGATTRINQQITINKAPLTIIADAKTKAYGDANPTLTLSYDGFVYEETIADLITQPAISTTATDASPAGNYPITVTGATSSNYIISFSNGTLTVNPKAQTITVNAPNLKTYGDADFSLGAAASSGLALNYTSSDSTVATVNQAGVVYILAAGSTTISVSQPGNSNYQASDVFSQLLTVNKAALTISADNKTKAYGDANPELTLTYTGFVNGETSAVLSGLPNVTTTATTDADAGTYPIEVGDVAAANYAITYVNGTLTINPNQQTLTIAAPSAKTYGDADFNLNASSSNSALPLTYTSSNPAIATVDASGNVHILAAGTVTISISQAGNSNYVAAIQTQTLTINKAALTVSAEDKTRVYGMANPAFTLIYAGFVNGETTSVFSTAPTVGSTATIDSPAGNYPITVAGGAADNYAFTYNTGTLTVAQPVISSVSLANATVFENQPAGTLAGTLSASSLDPNAVFTYTFLSGTGSADNNLFTILGNKILTAKSLNYEQQASYSILIRTTNQYGSYFDQAFNIQINDVNEAPTLAAITDQQVCYQPSTQNIALTGITPGPESAQTTTLSVSSTNPGLFKTLTISNISNGTATLNYTLAGFGTATITVTVKDNGGTANGGTDSFSQTFTLTANDMPVAAISSDKGTEVAKGQIVTLTATGGNSYSWGNAAGAVGATNTAVLQVRPAENTTYVVTATNASGCSTTASITINVADDYPAVQASNILTPNGDGKNDTWVVKNIDLYPESTIIIFDKGGRRLLNVKHYSNNWDGTFQGSPLTEGTYYYVIDFGQGKLPMKGFITLLRNR